MTTGNQPTVMLSEEELQKLTTLELLSIKRSIQPINSTVINRMSARLSELFSYQLGETLSVFWEDISLWSANSIIITGIRMFEIGDVVEDDEATVEIDDTNVSTLAQRVRIMVPAHIFKMLDDPSVSIEHIAAEMNQPAIEGEPTIDDAIDAHNRQMVPPTASHPLESDPLGRWLYQIHNQSTTKH